MAGPRTADPGLRSDTETIPGDEWPVPPDAQPAAPAEVLAAAYRGERRRRHVGPIPLLVAGVAAFLVAAAAAIIWLTAVRDPQPTHATPAPTTSKTTTPSPTGTAGGIELADVTGQKLATARRILEQQRFRVRVRRTASKEAPGVVLEQDPKGATKVSRGALVLLTVSGQPARTAQAATPSLVGRTLADARSLLERVRLTARVVRTESKEAPGTVLRQTPAAGTKLERGDAVTLVVARAAPAPLRIRVPSVVGDSAATAAARLRSAGLRSHVTLVASSQPRGTVISQSPPAGARVGEGTDVLLRVAKAKPVPQPVLVSVPSFAGSTVADARSRLQALGLVASVVQVASDEDKGTVISQSPSAGADVRKGATVTLRVSNGPAQVSVPSVVGLQEGSARSQLEGAGLQVTVVDQAVSDPSQDGVVVAQDPSGGAQAAKGSAVTITVGRLASP
jgi:beta-lactam-binding protein with PASTA domain